MITSPAAPSCSHRSLQVWELTFTAPNACSTPWQLQQHHASRISATEPKTVAEILLAAGWSVARVQELGLENHDWWYTCAFALDDNPDQCMLELQSLATVCEVWWNDEQVLTSQNMNLCHRLTVPASPQNRLTLCFRSLNQHLQGRKPRPRWNPPLVPEHKLRFVRTSLWGRMRSWHPAIPLVGPCGPIKVCSAAPERPSARLIPQVQQDVPHLTLHLDWLEPAGVQRSWLTIGNASRSVDLHLAQQSWSLPELEVWWPHTHGTPHLHRVQFHWQIEDRICTMDLGQVGFKTVEWCEHHDFPMQVNGQSIFLRGACWTPQQWTTGFDLQQELRRLSRLRDAGVNLLRVPGFLYPLPREVYDQCDQWGILIWQDFFFSNMDYPFEDPAFERQVMFEIQQLLQRWQNHACMAVLCGGSEVEQQAAMLGHASSIPFYQQLRTFCQESIPSACYFTSSPTGGVLPFHTDQGPSHYYGVGAYLRPVDDVKAAGVRFASECLGFAHVPAQSTLDRHFHPMEQVPHHPRWKQGVPRDAGSGWDFEDIRDHYFQQWYGISPLEVRYSDPQRYLELSRHLTAELTREVLGWWAKPNSRCAGALLWYLQDPWPGAGWGMLDVDGKPKSVYWAFKRLFQPQRTWITDEGLNGLQVHVHSDRTPFLGRLELGCVRHPSTVFGQVSIDLEVQPNQTLTFGAAELHQQFFDLNHSYRFGPQAHDAVVVTLRDQTGQVVAQDFQFVRSPLNWGRVPARIQAETQPHPRGVRLHLTADMLCFGVNVDSRDCLPSDNHFHLMPGVTRTLDFDLPAGQPFQAVLHCLQLNHPLQLVGTKT